MDKLIDHLRTLSTAILNPHHLTGEYVDKRFAGVAIEAANVIEDLPRWIPVTERLPKDSRDVIIYTDTGIVGVGICFVDTKNWLHFYAGGGMYVTVKYWMPVPDAPEVEE